MVLAAVVLYGAGAASVYYGRPARVEYVREKTEVHHKNETVDTQALVSQLAKLVKEQSEKRNVTKEVLTIREGGKETIKESFKDLTETNLRLETNTETLVSMRNQLKLLEDTLKLEREAKVVSNYPRQRVGVLLGYDFSTLLGRHESYNLLRVRGMVGQLQYERRLAGPLWWCAWAQTNLAAGGCLKAEW